MQLKESKHWDDWASLIDLIMYSPLCHYQDDYKSGWGDEEGLHYGSVWLSHPPSENDPEPTCVQIVLANDGGWSSVASADWPLDKLTTATLPAMKMMWDKAAKDGAVAA